ncbi:TPA: type II toxin-antitoxin system death-on-curing family toxin [Neisseria meningitidis]|jgi:death-on-curing family protein|uniref:Death-on-curing protein n=7 Tax=Neisseria TaxID=482 RepID=Q9JZS4_NEIMB|nr:MULTISPECIES: type II toxin-antitoxin system death-on-curing family toxin [Neisseria]AJC62566.1 death-on-curing protein [Neisseria meningitidis LNP21362]EGC52843.1 death-on-curing family protein [Neisseria meningitidis OX99.30304]EGC64580.1 death-on-curing family protein [Neisseria meningitidis 961-5945]EQD07662.1 death-on-curing family protein [Neisseria meningitidis NM151]EQD11582.1 death-on-curing family protein [Neisseria meningitidis NM0552]KER39926.1 death-on-curing family protein [N
MIDGELVALIHQTVLADEAGLKGRADMARLDGALSRIANWRQYENLEDIYEIAALYAQAIAKAHAFPDGNKRTALLTMLTYLDLQGISIAADQGLDDLIVSLAAGETDFKQLAETLRRLDKE